MGLDMGEEIYRTYGIGEGEDFAQRHAVVALEGRKDARSLSSLFMALVTLP